MTTESSSPSQPQSPGDSGKAAADAVDPIPARLRQVRRRLLANRLLAAAFLDLAIALGLFGIYLLVHRLVHLPLDPLAVLGVMAGTALLVSLARGGLLGRSTALQTAILVDDRLRLKERVSSAVYLRELTGGDPARSGPTPGWRELVERDGARYLAALEVNRHFPIKLPRFALWTLAPLAACIAIGFAVPQLDLLGLHGERLADAAMKKEVEKELETVNSDLAEIKETADKVEDPELKDLLEKLEKLANPEKSDPGELQPEPVSGEEIKKEALVQFSKLEDLLKKNLDKGDFDKLREFLRDADLARIDPSALTKGLQEAMKSGDFAKAADELKNLRQDLEDLLNKQKLGQLSKEDQEKLERLSREMQAMARNSAAMSKLSKALSGLSGNFSSGDLSMALQNLDSLGLDMQSLADLLKQMKSLDRSLELVKLSKNELAKLHKCPNCGKLAKDQPPGGTWQGGQGKEDGLWGGSGSSSQGRGRGSQASQSNGLLGGSISGGRSNSTGPNAGIGAGERDSGRPEDVNFQREQLHPQELDATGTIVGTLPFDGDAPKGEALLKIQKAAQAAQRKAEKVDREAIPIEYKDHVRRYMNELLPQAPAESSTGSSTGTSTEAPAGAPAKGPGTAGGER